MNLTDKIKNYNHIIATINAILDSKEHIELITIMANISNLIKETIDSTSWVGFYIYRPQNSDLILGPFAGKLACNEININKGVCGKAFKEKTPIIINDVTTIPFHIACDALSRSEIVLPLIIGKTIFGVLDIDSYNKNNFDDIDKEYLSKLLNILNTYYKSTF